MRRSLLTTSPTFFFVRLGMLIASLPLANAWNTLFPGGRGFSSRPRCVRCGRAAHAGKEILAALTLGQAFVAYVLFSVAMFGAVKARDQIVEWWKTGRLQPSGAL
jgi:hypothetical protein